MGELFTIATIWIALGGYGLSTWWMTADGASLRRACAARRMWTVGCACLILHIVAAFAVFHEWSHSAAYTDTAQKTAARVGVNWGGGLYVNYAFALAWVADCILWWRGGDAFIRRARKWRLMLHAFFLFMIFNATVVFGHGAGRWAGGILCVAIGVRLLRWLQ